MGIVRTLRFITTHPLTRKNPLGAVRRFLSWQLRSRRASGAIACPFVNDTRLLVRRGMTGATGNIYTGLHEFEDMAFVLHFLREEDLFVDAGANIGSYTILAAGACGASVLAAEPAPETFAALQDNIWFNGIEDRVRALRTALGAQRGELAFTSGLDCTNHVFSKDESVIDRQMIPVQPLDELLDRPPRLLKIDVEGYETAVLSGADRTLRAPELSAILIELNGAGKRYGFDEKKIHEKLTRLGFRTYRYHPFSRKLTPESCPRPQNSLYIRNIETVRKRVEKARPFRVLEKTI